MAPRKEKSLQGFEIAHLAEGNRSSAAAFSAALAGIFGEKGALCQQKAPYPPATVGVFPEASPAPHLKNPEMRKSDCGKL
jgi:hypothetical protein